MVSENSLGSNPNAIAYLVYANRGDPYSAGFKTPTTKDIPQIKLPRVEHSSDDNFDSYLRQVRSLENVVSSKLPDGQLSLTSHQDEHKSDVDLTPLSSIPEAFFAEEFKLDNPRVFDAVIGEEDSNLIQEKLSWYVDIVEAHLAREIARASTQFFAVTAQFGAIQEQAAQTSLKLDDFSQIAADQQLVLNHYNGTAKLQQKLEDAKTLCASMDLLAGLKRRVEELEGLVEATYGQSVDDPSAIKTCLSSLTALHTFTADTSFLDLARVKAALPLIERVEIAENKLKSHFANQFVAAMTASLRLTGQPNHELNDTLQKSAETALEAAKSLNSGEAALQLYQAEVDREIKDIMRRNKPVVSTEQGSEDSQALARSLHALSAEDADKMCHNLFEQLSDLFRALQGQAKSGAGNGFLEASVKIADNRLARILRVRKDPATSLSPAAFIKFYMQVTEFCNYCSEVTSGCVKATELEEFLLAQTKLYIHNMHALMETELIAEVEGDDWRRSDISPSVQLAVDLISKAGLTDFDSWDTSSASGQISKQRVEFESQTFVISRSTAGIAIKLINYLHLVSSLPREHSVGIGLQIIELLKLFGQKAHHQILGFRATKTAGLKHISVKNLMLCYESVRFVESLLEDIKRCLSRHLPVPSDGSMVSLSGDMGMSAEVLSSFDSVQQSYFDHRAEIHQKLVKLMSDKVSAYSRHIGITDWSQPVPQANKYMLDLIRQTTTVVHIAQEMLPPNISLKLVQEIYGAYKPKLLEAYANVHVETASEKRNVLRDLAYFRAKSEPFRGSGNTGDVIYESVNGFVAPELSAEPDSIPSSRPSMDLPRRSLDDGDATLTIDAGPDEEASSEHEDSASQTEPGHLNNTHTENNSHAILANAPSSEILEPESVPDEIPDPDDSTLENQAPEETVPEHAALAEAGGQEESLLSEEQVADGDNVADETLQPETEVSEAHHESRPDENLASELPESKPLTKLEDESAGDVNENLSASQDPGEDKLLPVHSADPIEQSVQDGVSSFNDKEEELVHRSPEPESKPTSKSKKKRANKKKNKKK